MSTVNNTALTRKGGAPGQGMLKAAARAFLSQVRINSLPGLLSFMAAMLLLALFGAVVFILIKESLPALERISLSELFGTRFQGVYTYGISVFGLLPALWGTFLVTITAVAIAAPVSLAMAVVANEPDAGWVGQTLRGILSVLGSVPPVVYALLSVVFIEVFFGPKLSGVGGPYELMPPPGMSWWRVGSMSTGGSTLMGGLMIAFLVIPFMAPLIDDAIRNVPEELKEASLALGAGRWQTLTGVVLPFAMTGIMASISLGALKGMGDVLIVGWCVGFESGLPTPLWDVLQRTPPLTATAAGLAGGFSGGVSTSGLRIPVAYFTGFLLLVLALLILLLVQLLSRAYKKRFGN